MMSMKRTVDAFRGRQIAESGSLLASPDTAHQPTPVQHQHPGNVTVVYVKLLKQLVLL